MHGIRRLSAAGLLGLAALSAPAGASAQAWIGVMAGNMAAQRQAELREKACRSGVPASPKDVTKANAKTQKLMDDYFALTSTSTAADLDHVFATRSPGTSWKGPDGPVAPNQLGARFDEPTPALVRVGFIVGGDDATARGVWSTTPPDGGAPVFYAVDFINRTPVRGSEWRIWHMTVVPAGPPPSPAGAYCHYDPGQAW